MKAEIITIGDEILLGQIIDSNSAWIAKELNLLSIATVQITSISDQSEAIISSLQAASNRADIIIVTGGLGPTKDDITKQTIAQYFNTSLIRDKQVLLHVEEMFRRLAPNKVMPEINKSQADVLKNCEVLFNDVGTAPGMFVAQNDKMFVFLPGVPFEMRYLISNRVIPKLKHHLPQVEIQHRHIITIGLGESFLADKIKDIEESLPDSIKLAYLPKVGMVRLRLTAINESSNTLDYFFNQFIERLDKHVVSDKDISVEQAIVESFNKSQLTLATAESCTGGSISSAITHISGASSMFLGSIIAYSNQVKSNILKVKEDTLSNYGAVSEQTVLEMVIGVKNLTGANYAIATSGIAGPTGGTEEKPVGTVWVAVAGKNKTITRLFHFKNDRAINIERTVAQGLAMLWNLYIDELV